jgi:tetratricopeptide (TPR) repeat protein
LKTIIISVLALVLGFPFLPSLDTAKKKLQGIRLYMEAEHLHKQANSKADLELAIQKYQDAVKVMDDETDTRRKAAAFSQLANIYWRLSRYDDAVESLRRSLVLCRKGGYTEQEAKALNNLGVIYKNMENYAQAEEQYAKALEIYDRLGDSSAVAYTYNNLGNIHNLRGEYDKSLKMFHKTLKLARKAQVQDIEAQAIGNLATVHYSRGDYEKGLGSFHEAHRIFEKLGDVRRMAKTAEALGTVYRCLGNDDRALDHLTKAMVVFKNIGDTRSQASTLLREGEVHCDLKDYGKAEKSFVAALQILERLGVSTNQVNDYLGNLYLELGNMEKAETCLKKAGYDSSLGRLYLAKADYQKSIDCYTRLLESNQKSKNATRLFAALTGLGTAYEKLEDYKKAEEYFAKAETMVEESRSRLQPEHQRNFYVVRIAGFFRSEPGKGLARVRMKLKNSQER